MRLPRSGNTFGNEDCEQQYGKTMKQEEGTNDIVLCNIDD
jgi:hypothetical protein